MTKTVLNFSDAVHSKAHNNQSCKHDLKLKGNTVTVTDADDHYYGDGWTVGRWIVVDVHDHVRRRLKLNPNETVNVTFSAKIERFIETIG